MQRNLSDIEKLPLDLQIKICADFDILSVEDIKALAVTSRQNYRLFTSDNSPYLWRKLLVRDFCVNPGIFENPKQAYIELYQERQRMIAYAHVLTSSEQRPQLAPVDFLRRRHDRPEHNPENHLSRLLLLRKYDTFLQSATEMLATLPVEVRQARHHAIKAAYSALFGANPETINTTLAAALKVIDNVVNRDQLHIPEDQAGNIAILISVLSKCGAHTTLKMLFSKLDGASYFEMMKLCGADLCRDAVMFGQKEIVQLLLRHQDDHETIGVRPDAEASRSLLFDEHELLLLPCALLSLQSLCNMREIRQLNEVDRAIIFGDFRYVIGKLCMAGANPYMPRKGHVVGFLGVGVLLNGNSLELASMISNQVDGMLLSGKDKNLVRIALEPVLVKRVNESMESHKRRNSSDSHKQQRDEFSEDEESLEELRTPPKKSRASSEGDIEFAYSPEAMDERDDYDPTSPLRRMNI